MNEHSQTHPLAHSGGIVTLHWKLPYVYILGANLQLYGQWNWRVWTQQCRAPCQHSTIEKSTCKPSAIAPYTYCLHSPPHSLQWQHTDQDQQTQHPVAGRQEWDVSTRKQIAHIVHFLMKPSVSYRHTTHSLQCSKIGLYVLQATVNRFRCLAHSHSCIRIWDVRNDHTSTEERNAAPPIFKCAHSSEKVAYIIIQLITYL